MKKLLFIIILLSAFLNIYNTKGQNLQRIAILPFESEGIDTVSIKTSREILKLELQRLTNAEIILVNDMDNYSPELSDIEAAVQAGGREKADQVVTCKFLTLGQKLIIHYSLIDVTSVKTLFFDSITSSSLEELDVVMKRMASGLMQQQPMSKTAETGNIVEQESKAPLSRSGRNFYSFSFGYLFPVSDDIGSRSFTIDYRLGSELKSNFEYGIQLFARNGFGANIFSSFLATKTDVCPYIGVGVGFHWFTSLYDHEPIIYTNTNYTREDKKEDGLEVLVNGGIKLFNTYNFRIVLNGTYSHTFNDFNTDTFIFTIGFIH